MALLVYAWKSNNYVNPVGHGTCHAVLPTMSSKYLQRAYGLEQISKLVSNAAPPVE